MALTREIRFLYILGCLFSVNYIKNPDIGFIAILLNNIANNTSISPKTILDIPVNELLANFYG